MYRILESAFELFLPSLASGPLKIVFNFATGVCICNNLSLLWLSLMCHFPIFYSSRHQFSKG